MQRSVYWFMFLHVKKSKFPLLTTIFYESDLNFIPVHPECGQFPQRESIVLHIYCIYLVNHIPLDVVIEHLRQLLHRYKLVILNFL